ncbi:hypothetical protein DM02DRAFT_648106 [Periconia macrospinosa]|uniref:Uncharacterized protein n=1 Tax=Periconia macrospinosa TaxID=97972 RepID=A0A2V1EDD3_9PLEO|nr:hypothetical protein DM02DRAFT_648106 [Periconia macrospinosa]
MATSTPKPSYTRYTRHPIPFHPLTSKIHRFQKYPGGSRFDVRATYNTQHILPQELSHQASSLEKQRIRKREEEKMKVEESWELWSTSGEPRIEDLFLKAKIDESEVGLKKLKEEVKQRDKRISIRVKDPKWVKKSDDGKVKKTVSRAKKVDGKKERLYTMLRFLVKNFRDAAVSIGVLREGKTAQVDWLGILLGIDSESNKKDDVGKKENGGKDAQKNQQQTVQIYEADMALPQKKRFDSSLVTWLEQFGFPSLALFFASHVPAAEASMLSSTTRDFLFQNPSFITDVDTTTDLVVSTTDLVVRTTDLVVSTTSSSYACQYDTSLLGSLASSLVSFFFSLIPLRNFGPVQPSSWTLVLDIVTWVLLLTPWLLSRTRPQKMNSSEQIVYVGLGLAATFSGSSSPSPSSCVNRPWKSLPLLFCWMKLSESRTLRARLSKAAAGLLKRAFYTLVQTAGKIGYPLLMLVGPLLAVLVWLSVGALLLGVRYARDLYVWAEFWYFIPLWDALWRLRVMIRTFWVWIVIGVCLGLNVSQWWWGDENEAVDLLARLVAWVEIVLVWLWGLFSTS